MKKPKKLITIFMLLLMLGNFFMDASISIVSALTSGEVYNYSLEVQEKIKNVKDKISVSESDANYLTDDAFKESVIYLKSVVVDYEEKLTGVLDVLDGGISLNSLITNSFPSKVLEYQTHMSNDTTIIDVSNITDITYEENINNVLEEKILLTKKEIEDAIKSYYLTDLYNELSSINNNYDSLITTYKDAYNGVITNIDSYIVEINTKKAEIEVYETTEVSLLNNPNMVVNDTNIYDLITTSISQLEQEKVGITISDIADKNTKVDGIRTDILTNINTFYLNNKDYLELGIDTEINSLETKYADIDLNLTNWFTDIDDYKNDNYSNYKDSLDTTLIGYYENIINLEEEYDVLIEKINEYLLRKPSDKSAIESLLVTLNDYRLYLNKEKVLTHIDNLVDLLITEEEDTIDLLLNFNSIKEVSDDVKEKIEQAKLSFYTLGVKDATYTLKIQKDYLVLNGVVGALTLEELANIIDYSATFSFTTLTLTDETKLNIYDKNNILIKSYRIIMAGDINEDLNVDLDDMEALKNEILKDELTEQEVIDRYDVNNDTLVDVNDVIKLEQNIVNSVITGETTTGSFEIERKEVEGLIYYNIYLKTDGIVKGFQFDINFTNDLVFKKLETTFNDVLVNDVNNPTKVLGYGSYKNNDLLISLVYEEDDTSTLTQTEFQVNNMTLTFDNLNSEKIDQVINIAVKEVITEVVEEETAELLTNQVSNEEEVEIVEEDEEEKVENKEEVEEITEKEIAWGNIVKIIIIVLLGTGIIYLLNKKDNEEEPEKNK